MTATGRLSAAELVGNYQAGVWRYLRLLGCDEARADDLTQETFLAVLKKPPEHRSDGQTARYLRTVARNQFLMSVRRSRRGPAQRELEAAEAVWAKLARDDGSGYLDALQDCLEHVNGRARTAIDLRYRDGRSRAEIAAELNMAPEGIKTLLRRTRDSLRRCIEGKIQ